MTTGAYCNNADCSHEFDKPSFAEILARKRECPACGTVNYVSDDLGTALDEAFAEVAELKRNTAAIGLPNSTILSPVWYTVSPTKED